MRYNYGSSYVQRTTYSHHDCERSSRPNSSSEQMTSLLGLVSQISNELSREIKWNKQQCDSHFGHTLKCASASSSNFV